MTTAAIDTRKDATMAGRHAARRSLRDDLFLLAHDEDHHFRPRTHPRALAIGLAGALFVDLLQDGAIWSENQHLRAQTPKRWAARLLRRAELQDPPGVRSRRQQEGRT